MRVPIELEAVTGLQPHIDRCHEIFPRFEDSLWVRDPRIVVFEKFLADPAEWTSLRGPRLVSTSQIGLPRTWTWKKPDQRLKCLTILIRVQVAVPKIVRIINSKALAELAAGTDVTLSSGHPQPKQQILVTAKLRGTP